VQIIDHRFSTFAGLDDRTLNFSSLLALSIGIRSNISRNMAHLIRRMAD
jgi:hypothetical protein